MVFADKINNQDGMVLMSTLMLLVILTICGIAAISISNNEAAIVRNEQLAAFEFYDAETGINDAILNYNNWLTDSFLGSDETEANATLDSVSVDDDGDPRAAIQVRCIENNNAGGVTEIFGDTADILPAMSHISTPPEGCGYSVKYFEVRRYGITSTSNDGNTAIQSGVWKVFNKQ